MPPKKKYYSVYSGRETGIFQSWDEVKPLVEGFKGARFKSFSNIEDAQYYSMYGDAAKKNPLGSLNGRNDILILDTKPCQNIPALDLTILSEKIEINAPPPPPKKVETVYTNKACYGFDQDGSSPGLYKIFFQPDDERNEQGLTPSSDSHPTCTKSELYAVWKSIELCKSELEDGSIDELRIYSSCFYSSIQIKKYMTTWMRTKFKTSRGTKPKNLELLIPIFNLLSTYPQIKIFHTDHPMANSSQNNMQGDN